MRVVIIGGVAGGMSAATRLRRLDESAEIIVLERSGHVSYANCGLPYYVGGVIAEEDKLYLQTPESHRYQLRRKQLVNVWLTLSQTHIKPLAHVFQHLVRQRGKLGYRRVAR